MTKKLLLGFMILISGFILVKLVASQNSRNILGETTNSQNFENTQEVLEDDKTKTISMGAVSLEITPKQLELNKKAVFEIYISTHSVDLDYDFLSVFKLSDETNNEYKTLEWTGGRGGHHLSGELIFNELQQNTKSVTLYIEGINDLSEQIIFSL